MRKLVISSLIVLMMSVPIAAQELSYLQNAVWRIAADSDDYVSGFATMMSNLPLAYRAQATMSDLVGYIKVVLGQPAQLGTVFHDDVYVNFISRYDTDSFRYAATVVVEESNRKPQNVALIADAISCDEDIQDPVREIHLWKFNVSTQFFDLQEDVAACAGGTCTFSGLANGHYVVGFTGAQFPSLDQFVNE